MKNTGAMLKSTRESKNLSLHEIGMSLKINPKTLQAIEDSEMDKLPPRTFLRGFVKSYAQYLKLDVKKVMDDFDFEMSRGSDVSPAALPSVAATATPVKAPEAPPLADQKTAQPPPKLSERAPNHIDRSKEDATKKNLLLMGGVLLAIIIIIVAKLVNKYQKERLSGPALVNVEPIKTTETQTSSSDLTSIVNPSLGSSDVTAASTLASADLEKASTNLASGNNNNTAVTPAQSLTPAVSPTPEPVEVKTTEANPVAEEVPELQLTPSNGKPIEVIIEARKKVSITFKLEGAGPQSIDMEPDEIHTFRSHGKINFEISDAGAVSLIVNGHERGRPGPSGQPIKLNYPK